MYHSDTGEVGPMQAHFRPATEAEIELYERERVKEQERVAQERERERLRNAPTVIVQNLGAPVTTTEVKPRK